VEPLVSTLKDAVAGVRWKAAKGLDALGWQPETPAQKALRHVALGECDRAAEAAAAAVDPLIAALQDRSFYKRQAAVDALTKLADPRVFKAMLQALNDEDLQLRARVIDSLAHIGDARAVEPLIKALKVVDPYVRSRAAEALMQLGDRRAMDALKPLLKDSSWEVRLAAIRALGKLDPVENLELLAKGLLDKDREIREASLRALQKSGDLRAIEYIVPALLDEQEALRKMALSILRRLDPQWQNSELARKSIPSLRAACKSLDYKVRKVAIDVLAEMGEPLPVDPLLSGLLQSVTKNKRSLGDVLVGLLKDSDRDFRLAASEALGRLGEKRHAEPLASALNDPDTWIGRATAHALKNLNWQPANPGLKARWQELLEA
jgi:HEAT repeat protein